MTAPPGDCNLCPRLAAFRAANRRLFPDHHNAPVPGHGAGVAARLLIVGLAPGLRGANRTGRPFDGDRSGDLLRATLEAAGWPATLVHITNAVKCVPPANRPAGSEIASCARYLAAELATLSAPAVLALGRVAHDAILRAAGLRPTAYAFAHGAVHALGDGRILFDSYHCSHYNVATGRLTPAMFAGIFATIAGRGLGPPPTPRPTAGRS
jgi:uracil-DNA glycosylase family 4